MHERSRVRAAACRSRPRPRTPPHRDLLVRLPSVLAPSSVLALATFSADSTPLSPRSLKSPIAGACIAARRPPCRCLARHPPRPAARSPSGAPTSTSSSSVSASCRRRWRRRRPIAPMRRRRWSTPSVRCAPLRELARIEGERGMPRSGSRCPRRAARDRHAHDARRGELADWVRRHYVHGAADGGAAAVGTRPQPARARRGTTSSTWSRRLELIEGLRTDLRDPAPRR